MRKQALTEKWDMTSVDSNEGKKCTGTRIQYCEFIIRDCFEEQNLKNSFAVLLVSGFRKEEGVLRTMDASKVSWLCCGQNR